MVARYVASCTGEILYYFTEGIWCTPDILKKHKILRKKIKIPDGRSHRSENRRF